MSKTITLDLKDANREIAAVLNRYSIDAKIGIPDFILSAYMLKCLQPLSDTWGLIAEMLPDVEDW